MYSKMSQFVLSQFGIVNRFGDNGERFIKENIGHLEFWTCGNRLGGKQ